MIFVTLILVVSLSIVNCEDVHSPFQYHSRSNDGTYNYGYDTGLIGSHQFHREYKEVNGQVTGRYGHTDHGRKPQSVNYRADQQGFGNIHENQRTRYFKARAIDTNTNGVITNSIDNNNRLERTSYKPTFSDSYRKPVPYIRPKIRGTPILIRKYRDSDNSRVYVAGRDYGELRANNQPPPIHRVEGPSHSFSNEVNRPIRRINTHSVPVTSTNEIRSFPLSNRMSTIRYNNVVPSYAPESSGYIPAPVSSTYESAPRSASYVSAPVSANYSPAPVSTSYAPVPSSYVPAPISASYVSAPVSSNYVPASRSAPPLGAPVPVVYSGRGIPSPSAAARLRAQALRIPK